MKRTAVLAIMLTISLLGFSQTEPSNFRVMAGIRVNPFIMYDLKGHKTEIMRLHAEVGTLINKRIYLSAGYTPFVNAIYNFNEYWFIGLDKKVPVSWVVAGEYSFDEKNFFLQSGLNVKLSKIGNMFVFGFTPVNNFNLGLKVGVFIPLNVVLKN